MFSFLFLGYNNPSYGPPPVMKNYSIGFDDPNTIQNNDPPMPYGNPVTTHNPMYNPGLAIPPPPLPSIGFNQSAEPETSKKSSFGSRNKIDDHKSQDNERNTDNRDKVFSLLSHIDYFGLNSKLTNNGMLNKDLLTHYYDTDKLFIAL